MVKTLINDNAHGHFAVYIDGHDVLNKHIDDFRQLAKVYGFKAHIRKPDSIDDEVKILMYLLKELKYQSFQRNCRRVSEKYVKNAWVWLYHKQMIEFEKQDIKDSFSPNNLNPLVHEQCYVDFPLYRHEYKSHEYSSVSKTIVTPYIEAYFQFYGLAVSGPNVYQKINNSLSSYENIGEIESFMNKTFVYETHYSRQFRLSIVEYFSTNNNYASLLPRHCPSQNLIEFQDVIYDIFTGKVARKTDLRSTGPLCCGHFIDVSFDEFKPPFKLLGLISELFAEKSVSYVFVENLAQLASFYHPNITSQLKKASYFSGESNTFKSFFMDIMVTSFIGHNNITILERGQDKSFATSALVEGEFPFHFVLFDDFRFSDSPISVAHLFNILDSRGVVSRKFKTAKKLTTLSSFIFTSNDSLNKLDELVSNLSQVDLIPFHNRISELKFHSLSSKWADLLNPAYIANLKSDLKEMTSFCILCNALAIRSFQKQKISVFNQKTSNQWDSAFEFVDMRDFFLKDLSLLELVAEDDKLIQKGKKVMKSLSQMKTIF